MYIRAIPRSSATLEVKLLQLSKMSQEPMTSTTAKKVGSYLKPLRSRNYKIPQTKCANVDVPYLKIRQRIKAGS